MEAARTYRMKWWLQAYANLCLLFMSIAAVACWFGKIPLEEGTSVESAYLGALAGEIFFILQAAYAFTAYVTISDSFIEAGSVFGKKSLPVDKIRRWSEYDKRDSEGYKLRFLKLESNDPHLRAIRLRKFQYAFDREFYEWLWAQGDLARLAPRGPGVAYL